MKIPATPYTAKTYDLQGLRGISSKTMEMHLALYEGYINQANLLIEKAVEFSNVGEVPPEKIIAYADLMRRLEFECNGVKLHEYYFENMKNIGGEPSTPGPLFMTKANSSFGTYAAWQDDFISTGKVRGVGWAICCEDPSQGRISNHWIFLHDMASLETLRPIIILDAWEHAYLLDFQPSERGKYTTDFISNIDWEVIEARLKSSAKPIEIAVPDQPSFESRVVSKT